jgi:hypothetical protein
LLYSCHFDPTLVRTRTRDSDNSTHLEERAYDEYEERD